MQQDKEIYQHFIGLPEPWAVDRVEFNLEDRRVDVWAGHSAGVAWSCPECAITSPTRDHAAERVWRHLDSCQFETYLHARIPRVACPDHGVRQIHVPWAEPDSRFTRQFERLAVGILAECRVSGTAAVLGLSWDEAQGMQERAARRREARKSARLQENSGKGTASSQADNGHESERSVHPPHTIGNSAESRRRNSASSTPTGGPTRSGQNGQNGRPPSHGQCQQRTNARTKFPRRVG